MREQLEIIISIDQVSSFSATVGTRLTKHFDKGLAMMLKATRLEDIRRLSGSDKRRLARKMQLALTRNDLKAISRLWEKDRTISNDESHSELFENLVALLMGAREPYQKLPASFTLKKARELGPSEQKELVARFRDWAPNTHVKALAKKWDKHNTALLSAPRDRQVSHLVALVAGQIEPAPKR